MADLETGFNRRRFLARAAGVGGGVAAGALLGPLAAPSLAHGGGRLVPRNRIGLQLYTVRDMLAADPAGTLQKVAAIGYRKVELAGLAGLTAAQFRALADANGLKIVGAHMSIVDLRANVDAVLENAEILGLEWVGVGAMSYPFVFNPPRPFAATTEAAYRALAAEANRYGAAARARGFRGFYAHIHDWDHWPDPATGRRVIDVFLEASDPRSVFVEPDLFWMVNAGRDPIEFFDRWEHRAPLIHVKDRNPGPPVPPYGAAPNFGPGITDPGTGAIDFRTIFESLERGKQKEYIVERDTQVNPLLTAQVGSDFLRNLRGSRHGRGRRHGRGHEPRGDDHHGRRDHAERKPH
jgi:sugar phosphate isomerase/epimerase